MKLRIHGNSIRLRLSQTDVERLGEDGTVESVIDFGTGSERLVYRLSTDENIDRPVASFSGGEIVVRLPKETTINWTKSDEIGIEADQQLNGGALQILIEKDFACLTPRPGNQDADAYPHPLADKLF